MATYYVDTAVGSDSNAGTSAGAGNAWATIGKATATMAAGDTCNIKASGNYNESVACATTSGTASAPLTFVGYTTTVGDGGQVTIDGQNTRANCLTTNGMTNYVWQNFIFQGATTRAFDNTSISTTNWRFTNCRFTKGSATPATGIGSSTGSYAPGLILVNCLIDNFTGNCLDNWYDIKIYGCTFHTCAMGINVPSFFTRVSINANLFRGCSTAGIAVASETDSLSIKRNNFRACGDGIRINGSNHRTVLILGNVSYGNTGYDVNVQNVPSGTTFIYSDYNFWKTASSGQYHNITGGSFDTTLTADPYTSSTDLTLNTTAGGGAAVRAAGFPGTMLSGEVGYGDGGALQHQDSGGAAPANPLSLILQPPSTY